MSRAFSVTSRLGRLAAGRAMRARVARRTEPLYFQWHRVIGMVRLNGARLSAALTRVWPTEPPCLSGTGNSMPRSDFKRISESLAAASFADMLGMRMSPFTRPQSTTFWVRTPPFVAMSFGAFWVCLVPCCNDCLRAGLTVRAAAAGATFIPEKLIKGLTDVTSRTTLHQYIILSPTGGR